MALTDAQLAILKTELATDPMELGYSQAPNYNDPADAELLNTIGLSGETIGNTQASASDVMDTIAVAEFGALYNSDPGKVELFKIIMSRADGYFDITNTYFVSQMLNIFTNAQCPDTRAALIALGTRPCSRAEKLFGAGVNVTHLDIAHARQLP